MHWQRNPFAVQPLVLVAKGVSYDTHYRTGVDRSMRVLQDFVLVEIGKTFRLLPAKTIRLPLTDADYDATTPNFYYDVHAYLQSKEIKDSTSQRVEFCNWKRTYTLCAPGTPVGLANMAGAVCLGLLTGAR